MNPIQSEWGLGDAVQAPQNSSSTTTWIVGGLLVAAAIGVYALEKRGPAPLRRV